MSVVSKFVQPIRTKLGRDLSKGKGDSDLYNEDDLSWGGAIRGPKRGEILYQMRDADFMWDSSFLSTL